MTAIHLAICPGCGRIPLTVIDDPDNQQEAASLMADALRAGYVVNRRSEDEALPYGACRCPQLPPRGERATQGVLL